MGGDGKGYGGMGRGAMGRVRAYMWVRVSDYVSRRAGNAVIRGDEMWTHMQVRNGYPPSHIPHAKLGTYPEAERARRRV